MSEYTGKIHNISFNRSASGHVGYEEGGQLTEKVRRKPYSIVLLDEIEKHIPISIIFYYKYLMMVKFTDGLGRKVILKTRLSS